MSYYGARDVRVAAGRALNAGDLYVDDRTLAFRDVVASEIYTDFYRPHRLGQCMAAVLFKDPDRVGVLSTHRAVDRGAFAPREIARFEAITPHVIRALQWQRQLGHAREAAGAMEAALDRFAQAVFLVRRDRRFVHANAAATEMLARPGCALRLERGRLVAVARAADPILGAYVLQSVRARQGTSAPPPILRLPDATGSLALLIVAPSSGDVVLVFAAHSADRLRADPEVLRQAFGLSRSEADVACSLAAGEAAETISARRGGAIGTVRTQIKVVMGKLGVRRQSELVSAVATGLAALRRPNRPG